MAIFEGIGATRREGAWNINLVTSGQARMIIGPRWFVRGGDVDS